MAQPRPVMNKFITLIDQTSDRLGKAASWRLLMVLVMGLIVTLRYVFQIGSIALRSRCSI